MTGLTLARRRAAATLSAFRLELAAFALVVAAAIAAMTFGFQAPARGSGEASVTAPLTAAQNALILATSAAASEQGPIGEQAQLINAALPFSAAPLEASRPFALGGGDDLDVRRALLCMTQAVYYEAGFEPVAGRRAVAQVVLNRMRHPAFPNSVCGVVYQGARSPVCQFSFVCDGSLNRAPAPAAWREAKDVAAAALAGHVEKSVGTATHYHADYVAPRWAPMLTKLAKLGAHIFYRWPGGWGRQAAFTARYGGEPSDPASLRPLAGAGEPGAEAAIAAGPVADGTMIKRAPNDVGGLLDVSKGWTLEIPGPQDISSGAAKAVAEQEGKTKPAAPVAAAASTAGAALASR